MDRVAYLLRRLLLMIPTFIGITIVCFALTRFLPGGPVEIRLMRMKALGGADGGKGAAVTQVTQAYKEHLNRQFGFDRPVVVQYWNWLVTNRMGLRLPSYDHPEKTAWELIRARIPVSLWFGLASFVLTYLVCVPLGIAKALRHRQTFDVVSSLIVFAAYAVPAFALAMALKTCCCGTVDGLGDWFPLGGLASDFDGPVSVWTTFKDRVWHMVLPILCYVAGNFALLTLLMKNALLDQISADYVRTVIAKGASRRRAVWGHAFRNALIPVATGIGSLFSVFFAGSVIIERIFEIPGMGRLSLDALEGRDYTVFLALLALTSLALLIGGLVSDLLYMLIDPRVDFSRK